MQSVFVESLNLSQVKDLNTRIHTIQYYVAEIYPDLLHWWVVYAILLLSWGIHCLITLLSYTQRWYIAEVYSTSIFCWAIPNPNTLLRSTQSYYMAQQFQLYAWMSYTESWHIVDVYLVLLQCWVFPNILTLLKHILSYHIAELFSIIKCCWCITLFYYIAEKLPIFIQCSSITCLVTSLSCSPSYKIAEAYLVF